MQHCHQNDDGWHECQNPTKHIGPIRIDVRSSFGWLVFDPIEDENKLEVKFIFVLQLKLIETYDKCEWSDKLPHISPHSFPGATLLANHFLNVSNESLSTVVPSNQQTFCDCYD